MPAETILLFRDPDMQLFGARLKAARDASGLTQAALAWRCDFNLPTLNRLERGVGKGLRAVTLARLAQALSISTDYLLGLSDCPHSGVCLSSAPCVCLGEHVQHGGFPWRVSVTDAESPEVCSP